MSKILLIFRCNVNFFVIVTLLMAYCMDFGKALVGSNVRSARGTEFPFVTCLIQLNPRLTLVQNVVCAGSLISKSKILTSEHCIYKQFDYAIFFMIGHSDLHSATTYSIQWFITYDQWALVHRIDLIRENDIAVVELIDKVPDTIRIAQLATRECYTNLVGTILTLVGWGINNNGVTSQTLLTVNTTIISINECMSVSAQLAGDFMFLPAEVYLCSRAVPYALLRAGDSGSPILYGGVIVGISKATCPTLDGGIHPQKMNIHIRLDLYSSFLTYILNNYV